MAESPRRGPQARFTVEDITAAACRLADDDGLSAVSLAKVAGGLGLTTTALYRYVDSKDALIALMTDQAIGVPPSLDDLDWRRGVDTWVSELWLRYTRHRWLTEVRVAGMPQHPNRLHWMNALLLDLDRGAIDDPMHVALLLDSVARAFAAVDAPAGDDVPPPTWLPDAIRDRFPRLAQELSRDWTDAAAELTQAVETVLRGATRPAQ